jgi:hypothetical protein
MANIPIKVLFTSKLRRKVTKHISPKKYYSINEGTQSRLEMVLMGKAGSPGRGLNRLGVEVLIKLIAVLFR